MTNRHVFERDSSSDLMTSKQFTVKKTTFIGSRHVLSLKIFGYDVNYDHPVDKYDARIAEKTQMTLVRHCTCDTNRFKVFLFNV